MAKRLISSSDSDTDCQPGSVAKDIVLRETKNDPSQIRTPSSMKQPLIL
jgi:hypothetical protein